jgi:uncharacterized protein YycO
VNNVKYCGKGGREKVKSKRRLFGLAIPVIMMMTLIAYAPTSAVLAQDDKFSCAELLGPKECQAALLEQLVYHCKGNNLDLSKAEAGDIFLFRPVTIRGILPIPPINDLAGEPYVHAAMYIGDGKMIEPMPFVHILDANKVLGADQVALLRVNTSDEIRIAAVDFTVAQIGKWSDPMDLLLPMQKHKVSSPYYCTEFVWAAYMAASNGEIDLDGDTFLGPDTPFWLITRPITEAMHMLTGGELIPPGGDFVTPNDIIKSGYCTVIGESPKHYIQQSPSTLSIK